MKINNNTGEVLPEFRSMWSNPKPYLGDDCSNEYEEVFEEVPAFFVDYETGKLLNDSSVPKIISKGKVNIQERIQSFATEVDIYSILEKFAYSQDNSLLNARACSYGDISGLPDNLNDYTKFIDAHYKNLKSINPELASMILDENVKPEDIEKKANEIYQMRLEDYNKNLEAEKNGGNE